MRTPPRTLIATMSGVAALAAVASTALAHSPGGAHGAAGTGGTIEPGMMGAMGSGMIDLMADWVRGQGIGDHSAAGEPPVAAPAMPDVSAMPGQGMGPGALGPRMPEMPQMPSLPGAGGAPGMMAPSFQLQMAPGWSG